LHCEAPPGQAVEAEAAIGSGGRALLQVHENDVGAGQALASSRIGNAAGERRGRRAHPSGRGRRRLLRAAQRETEGVSARKKEQESTGRRPHKKLKQPDLLAGLRNWWRMDAGCYQEESKAAALGRRWARSRVGHRAIQGAVAAVGTGAVAKHGRAADITTGKLRKNGTL